MSHDADDNKEPSIPQGEPVYRPSAKEILTFLLKGIEETAKQSRSLVLVLSSACAFVLVAAFSQGGAESIKLPIIGNEIKPDPFFVFSPLILLCIYLYLQVYIQELRGRFSRVKQFQQRVRVSPELSRDLSFPWFFVTSLEERERARNQTDQDEFGRLDQIANHSVPLIYPFAVFVIWLMGPLVLAILWLLFIHEGKPIALVPCAAFAVSAIVAIRCIKYKISKFTNVFLGVCFGAAILLTLASIPYLREKSYLAYLWQARFSFMQWTQIHATPVVLRALAFAVPVAIVAFVVQQLLGSLLPLRSYRKALTRALDNLTTSGSRIEDIYVPLKGRVSGDPGEEIWIERSIDRDSPILVTGPGGSGKTTALTRIALDLARSKHKGAEYAPIFITLRWVNLQASLEKTAMETLSKYGVAKPSHLLTKLAQRGRIAFIFDGIDELEEVNQRNFLQALQGLVELFPRSMYLASSRVASFPGDLGNIFKTTVEIAPLSEVSTRSLVDRFFAPDKGAGASFWSYLHQSELSSLRNPLLLAVMMSAWDRLGSLPTSLEHLIQISLKTGLSTARPNSASLAEIEEFLRLIGVQMRYNQTTHLDHEHYLSLAKQVMKAHGDSRSVDEFIIDLTKTGLIDVRQDGVAFAHRAVQELYGKHG